MWWVGEREEEWMGSTSRGEREEKEKEKERSGAALPRVWWY